MQLHRCGLVPMHLLRVPPGMQTARGLPSQWLMASSCSLSCLCAAPEAGYWRLHVSCNGQPLPRTPFSVHVVQPAAAAAAVLASSHPQCSAVDAKAGASSGDGCARPDGEPSSGSSQLATVPPTPALPPPGPPVRDEMSSWARIAAEAFAADGSTEGWDSDAERKESKKTKEQEYIEVLVAARQCWVLRQRML